MFYIKGNKYIILFLYFKRELVVFINIYREILKTHNYCVKKL